MSIRARQTSCRPDDKQVRGTAYPGEALLEAFEAHGESKAIVIVL